MHISCTALLYGFISSKKGAYGFAQTTVKVVVVVVVVAIGEAMAYVSVIVVVVAPGEEG